MREYNKIFHFKISLQIVFIAENIHKKWIFLLNLLMHLDFKVIICPFPANVTVQTANLTGAQLMSVDLDRNVGETR